ncbi:AraC family transcriptional regulator [Clostridium perfringens]|uniref:Putative lactose operon transcription activator n=1 Tax=Clostridium perfringens TaxID=1502 RepID=A0A133MUX6_CLOPF|nr:AraC family transcriptional regulator [Clostridium perfringens]KXA07845.1 putative lactose operon transcription activator [Clostridium perfringens]MBS5920406.1 AraC family transcriptional regulator [Clostridium perfringens]MCH1962113.1 AraC family transcriptional regulator [Clostridium perfringens]MDK0538197.1 AraC family transcriptional regulator [Clostridium perfringens]MDK0563585.1 AraC family transcriptional regulator [Clostridium perfringens]
MQILWKKYVKENFEMNVDECGIEQGIPGLGYNYEVLKNAVIHYVTKGYGTFKFNGKVYNLKQGDIFILLKGMQVEYVASIDDPWEYYWIGFSGSNANEYLNRTSITDSCVANCEENSKIPQIILNMCEISKTYNPSRSDDILLLKELYSLLYALIEEFPKPFEYKDKELHTYIQDALNFINSNYMHSITVQEIADYVNLSRSYLYKMFIKNLGISPQRYLINLRMYKATLLLKGTKLPIGEVASSVGYSDSLLFSKTFSKHFSMSPLNYRNNQVNKPNI